jgi:putative LysE/RhtB family amino acid efflux pump
MKKRKGISEEIPLASETFFTSFRLSLLATAANPATIISWVALLAAASTYIHTLNEKVTFASGVGVGSLAFFLTLAIAAAQLGKRLRPRLIDWIDQVATALFFLFALALAYRAFTI